MKKYRGKYRLLHTDTKGNQFGIYSSDDVDDLCMLLLSVYTSNGSYCIYRTTDNTVLLTTL